MGILTYTKVTDQAVIEHVAGRFATEIAALEELGFQRLCIASEMFFPFSLIVLSPLYLIARAMRQPTFVASPLRFGHYLPIMVCYETCCFAAPQPMGVKYYTRFMDGTVLVSANFTVSPVNDTHNGFFKYADDKTTMEQCHQRHQERAKEHLRLDRIYDHNLEYETLIDIGHFEDHYMYGAPLHKPKLAIDAVSIAHRDSL